MLGVEKGRQDVSILASFPISGTRKWNRGCSALHIASYFGHSKTVELLLADQNIDIDVRNNHSETALHKASLTGRLDIARLLLSRSASVFCTDDFGRTPGDIAASDEMRHMIKGPCFVLFRLFGACPFIRSDFAVLISDAEAAQRADQTDRMFRACQEGNMDALLSVMSGPYPPSVTQMDLDGNSALHHAVLQDHKEIASLLIERGFDPSLRNCQGLNANRLTEKMIKIRTRIYMQEKRARITLSAILCIGYWK